MTSSSRPLFVMYVDTKDDTLRDWYKRRVEEHNTHVRTDPCPNSGFDLATPSVTLVSPTIQTTKVITNVKGKMMKPDSEQCMGYYMYPRSSLSKSPLVLANHVGIIDSGYRGPLTGAFRNLAEEVYRIDKFDRLLQVCHASLEPFEVCMVDSEEELGQTNRGQGGFGSTGS
jgi:deoxyuridine 5'-triphosphate nucleotidohydrolase